MDLFKSGLLLFLLHSIESKDCVIDNRSPETAWEQQLRDDVTLCSYRHEPPDMNNTQVTIKLFLKSFNFDKKEKFLIINTWLMLFWNDSRLSWNPEHYDGIKEVLISSMYIWTPNLKVYSSSNIDTLDGIYLYVPHCRVNSSGHVSCIPRIVYHSVCSSKLSDWPYDTQNCSFSFGPRSKADRTTFTSNSSRIVLFGAEYGPGWNIIGHTVNEDPKSTVQYSFNFVLERQGVGLAASVVVPPLVLSSITFISMLLDVEDTTRLGLLCFCLLNQFYFLQVISTEIPSNSADVPTVLLYLRSLLIWTVMAIGVTFFLRYLKRKSTPPSHLVQVSIDKIFDSYGKYLIWPRWDAKIVENGGNNDTMNYVLLWTDFASVINFVFMVIIAIVSVTYYFAYIPQQIT